MAEYHLPAEAAVVIPDTELQSDRKDSSNAVVFRRMPQQNSQEAPIFQLPEELLLRIIREYADQGLSLSRSRSYWPENCFDRTWATLRTVCRHWDAILLDATYMWSYIELSWPKRLVDFHLSRRKSALLHISWKPPKSHFDDQLGLPWQDWIGENLSIMEELHLGIYIDGGNPSEESQRCTNLLATCLKSSSHSLKHLDIGLGTTNFRGKTVSGHLPPLLTPNLRTLELSDCDLFGHFVKLYPFGALLSTPFWPKLASSKVSHGRTLMKSHSANSIGCRENAAKDEERRISHTSVAAKARQAKACRGILCISLGEFSVLSEGKLIASNSVKELLKSQLAFHHPEANLIFGARRISLAPQSGGYGGGLRSLNNSPEVSCWAVFGQFATGKDPCDGPTFIPERYLARPNSRARISELSEDLVDAPGILESGWCLENMRLGSDGDEDLIAIVA
ncbi:hypothetical protein SISNIDRAFT_469557 [Sistotremastrum niveocremeum HHB9708]|uniref:Uncharacterized protein n=1 Tax=Sistotremastrum niveocremeum HHB9708 TaxID=1314777 RepID=A0A164PUF9_9AGAM|nr:hypothetical protein SISNIDRAFT_469557 [Sistotremastrum niveocremeum HHB9708]